MKEKTFMIGVVGGMGPYATVDFFKRLVDAFPAEKDWLKPRIIVDSYSSIPSRVRAVLYGEQKEEVVNCLASSIQHLSSLGAVKIIVACHTAHIFLPEVLEKAGCGTERIIHIIKSAVPICVSKNYRKIRLLASEGTIQAGIYKEVFQGTDIEIINPGISEMFLVRELIEDVKQGKVTKQSLEKFQNLVNKDNFPVLLGCSELPVIYGECVRNQKILNEVIDPLQCAINCLKEKQADV